MHTLKVSVVEVVKVTVVMVAVEVTKQMATQRILTRRKNINPLAEEALSIRSLPALVRARYWQLTERFPFPLHS